MLSSKNPYGVNSFLCRWAKANPPKMLFKAKTKAAAKAWQRRFLKALRGAIGPLPEAGSLEVRKAATKRCAGYRQEKLYLRASPWHELPLYLLVPDGATKAPVVLALHGHGAGAVGPLDRARGASSSPLQSSTPSASASRRTITTRASKTPATAAS